jgi:hypothetical protein
LLLSRKMVVGTTLALVASEGQEFKRANVPWASVGDEQLFHSGKKENMPKLTISFASASS